MYIFVYISTLFVGASFLFLPTSVVQIFQMPLLNAIFNNFLDFDYSDWDEDTISTDDDSTTADETNFTEAEVEDGIEMFSSVMRMDMKDWTVLNN